MPTTDSLVIDGTEIETGETLNRLGNVATRGGEFVLGEKTPSELLREVAEEIIEKTPDDVETDSVDTLHSQLQDDGDFLDEVDSIRFYSMRVDGISADVVHLHDWKTERTVEITRDDLARHLGKTIFTTT